MVGWLGAFTDKSFVWLVEHGFGGGHDLAAELAHGRCLLGVPWADHGIAMVADAGAFVITPRGREGRRIRPGGNS